MMKILFAALIAIAFISTSVLAADIPCQRDVRGEKIPRATVKEFGKLANINVTSTKNILRDTPSINEMSTKKAVNRGYITDPLGNKIPTETDNSGKNFVGM